MGGFSYIHWLIIAAVALLLFGNRLPDVARSLGRSVNEFKKGLKEVKDDLDDDEPPKKKLRDPDESDRVIEDKSDEHKDEPVSSRTNSDSD
ncbi:MAG: twin-arginine translocase TatA/TatE family subunit [Planctomycetes bacterium]|nr:twin-arginine translocase TatA/TatE family subunit [Planctomycetota bacterium]